MLPDEAGRTLLVHAASGRERSDGQDPAGKRKPIRTGRIGRGGRPLIYAALHGHAEVAQRLIDSGARLDASSNEGWTALGLALSQDYVPIIDALLEAGGGCEFGDPARPVLPGNGGPTGGASSRCGNCWNGAARVGLRGAGGQTALAFAAYQGFPEIVKLLLDRGAVPDAKDDSGRTPLMQAAWNGHAEVAELLLDRGAGIDAQDGQGVTGLGLRRVPRPGGPGPAAVEPRRGPAHPEPPGKNSPHAGSGRRPKSRGQIAPGAGVGEEAVRAASVETSEPGSTHLS